jgi:hypothetical protein
MRESNSADEFIFGMELLDAVEPPIGYTVAAYSIEITALLYAKRTTEYLIYPVLYSVFIVAQVYSG